MKYRRLQWSEHLVEMGETGRLAKYWWGSLLESDHLENQDGNWRTTEMDLKAKGTGTMKRTKLSCSSTKELLS